MHFRPSDYGKLTIIGVIIACAAWPVVTRISSAPRWLFFRLAILVTLVLLLPDLYLLYRNQPVEAVSILMSMHLAIGLVTYNALVRIAPPRRREQQATPTVEDPSPSFAQMEPRRTQVRPACGYGLTTLTPSSTFRAKARCSIRLSASGWRHGQLTLLSR